MGALGLFSAVSAFAIACSRFLALFFPRGQFLLVLSFALLFFSLGRKCCSDGSSIIGLARSWLFSRRHCFDRCLLDGALAELLR